MKAKIQFEADIVELLKKYGIESKQPIFSIRILIDVDSLPDIEVNSKIVDFIKPKVKK